MTVLSSIVHDEDNISLQQQQQQQQDSIDNIEQQQDSFRMLAQYLSTRITDLEDGDEMIQKSIAGTREQISRLDDKVSQILSLFLEEKEEMRRSFLLARGLSTDNTSGIRMIEKGKIPCCQQHVNIVYGMNKPSALTITRTFTKNE